MSNWIKESNMTSSTRLIWSQWQDVGGSVLSEMTSMPLIFWCLVVPCGLIVLLYLVTVSPKITAVRKALQFLISYLLILGVTNLFFLMVRVMFESLSLGSITIQNLAPIQFLVSMICFLAGFHLKNKYL